MRSLLMVAVAGLVGGCAAEPPSPSPESAPSAPASEEDESVDRLAESYVRLVLALGEHQPDYVDAYIGPPEWRQAAREEGATLGEIRDRATADLAELPSTDPDLVAADDIEALRLAHLRRSYEALIARVDLLSGVEMTFDEESRALYDAVAPSRDEAHFRAILERLAAALPPGEGTVSERYEALRAEFEIPPEALDAVLRAAIDACRERTASHIELPAEESFTVEYVTDKSWSGYNWYQGGYRSLIQINTDLPVHIDRALDLACHEGYPGHHVYNVLAERDLTGGHGWIEFAVYPLFSPRSLIAEGSAEFGIEVAFPDQERLAFERSALFPLAGLDPARAAAYYEALELAEELSYAGNEAARRYLDGEIDAEAAAAWLSTYALMTPERAAQRVRFINQYRSYVINYNLGQDLVRAFIESRGGTADRPDRRWAEFESLLTSPRLPSQLRP